MIEKLPTSLLNLALSVSAILGTLLLLELVTRVAGWAPEVTSIEIDKPYAAFVSSFNPILKYEPKPGSPGINSIGMRDREFAERKPDGTKRIAVLGDSIAFGFCNDEQALPANDTFPKILEQRLNEHDQPHVEVLNFAVSGYDTVQEAETLKMKAVNFDPDLIVIAVCVNDSWDASAELVALSQRATAAVRQGHVVGASVDLRSLYGKLFRYSSLFRWLALRVDATARTSIGEAPMSDRIRDGFGKIRAVVPSTPVLAVMFPLFDNLGSYKHLEAHGRIQSMAESFDFQWLDLLPAFQRESREDGLILQRPCNREHPNPVGHKVAADELLREIRERNLLH